MIVFIIFFFFLSSPHQLKAISPTPTPAVLGQKEIEDIQNIREAVQQKVIEKIKEITSAGPRIRAYMGNISEITATNIIIDYKNNSRTLTFNSETTIIDLKRNKITSDKLKAGQDILAMGILENDNTLSARRIVVVDLVSTQNQNETIVGKVVDVSKSSPVFILIPLQDKNIQYQVKTDTKTEYVDQKGSKLDLKSGLNSGQKIAAILKPDPKIAKTFNAIKIVVLDSPSASPTPTLKN